MRARGPRPNIGRAASTARPTSAGSSSPGKRSPRAPRSSRRRRKSPSGWPRFPSPVGRGVRGEGLRLIRIVSNPSPPAPLPQGEGRVCWTPRQRRDMLLPMLIPSLLLALAAPAAPLLTPAETRAIADEVSGSAAKRTVQALSLHHRMRGSEGYRAAAELIRGRLADYGLEEADIISLPADGRIFYGTQRSRPAWNASFAELWEERQQGGAWADAERVASWADQPIGLAQDS